MDIMNRVYMIIMILYMFKNRYLIELVQEQVEGVGREEFIGTKAAPDGVARDIIFIYEVGIDLRYCNSDF